MIIRALIVFCTLLLAACASTGSITKVQLERSPCPRGTCPAYSLEVSKDGSVNYQGSSNVKVTGSASGSISQDDWKLLKTAVQNTRFFSMEDRLGKNSEGCTTLVNHHPTIKISVTRGHNTKQVAFYTGCWGLSSGKLLAWLANTTDMVTDSTKWTHEQL